MFRTSRHLLQLFHVLVAISVTIVQSQQLSGGTSGKNTGDDITN